MTIHKDVLNHTPLKKGLGAIIHTSKKMMTLLNSLIATSKSLQKSGWTSSTRKADRKAFNGPALNPTRGKVNRLCNRLFPELQREGIEVIKAYVGSKAKGDLKQLLGIWEQHQRKLETYLGTVLKELSRDDDSAVLKALRKEGSTKPKKC